MIVTTRPTLNPFADRVTNVGLSALLASSPGLQRLSLYWNLNVSNDTLLFVAALCTGLRALSLSGCKNVTDAGVRALARACPGLTALDLTRYRAALSAGGPCSVIGWYGKRSRLRRSCSKEPRCRHGRHQHELCCERIPLAAHGSR